MIWLLGSKSECGIRTYAVSLIDGNSTQELEDVGVTILIYLLGHHGPYWRCKVCSSSIHHLPVLERKSNSALAA